MRVLVTGAGGFVGRHVLAPLLAAEHQVFALARRSMQPQPGLCLLAGDLLAAGEPERIMRATQPDIVLHLAWTVEHGKFWTDPANLEWVDASLALLRAGAAHGITRFVGVGTCFEYDWPDEGNCDEQTTRLLGHQVYGAAKSSFRAQAQLFCQQNSLDFAWARLFYLYGAGEHPARLVADIARHIAAGEPAACSSGQILRDYMDVRDAGRALAMLTMSPVTGSINIASGEALRVVDIATMLGDIGGRPDLVRLGARADQPGEPPRIVANINRLREEVGFSPHVDLATGLADALRSWHAAPIR